MERMDLKDDAYVLSRSPGGGTGDEVCRLGLQLVLICKDCYLGTFVE